MGDTAFPRNEVIGLVIRLTLVSAVTYFSIKWIIKQVDPTNASKKKAKLRAEEQLKKPILDTLRNNQHVYDMDIYPICLAKIETAIRATLLLCLCTLTHLFTRLRSTSNAPLSIDRLTDYELMIAAHLVHPQDIKISWDDIAGLESLIQELRETVILPIQRRELFADSQLTTAPKGVLLHGPPGCGKTLIAKATAKEASTRFINLDVSMLTDKWYGESQKLAAAVFTLAVKIQPCIIFIDEIDSFLRSRTSSDHEATAMMKAQFMALWDGLITDTNSTVIIMGATNRPQDLDKAILRRMPATFHIPMPNVAQRTQIMRLILENEPISEDVDVNVLAKCTEGFSGSDLREMCRNASVYRVRDYLRNHIEHPTENDPNDSNDEFHDALRPITMDDLKFSWNKMRDSKIQCGSLSVQTRIDLD